MENKTSDVFILTKRKIRKGLRERRRRIRGCNREEEYNEKKKEKGEEEEDEEK